MFTVPPGLAFARHGLAPGPGASLAAFLPACPDLGPLYWDSLHEGKRAAPQEAAGPVFDKQVAQRRADVLTTSLPPHSLRSLCQRLLPRYSTRQRCERQSYRGNQVFNTFLAVHGGYCFSDSKSVLQRLGGLQAWVGVCCPACQRAPEGEL